MKFCVDNTTVWFHSDPALSNINEVYTCIYEGDTTLYCIDSWKPKSKQELNQSCKYCVDQLKFKMCRHENKNVILDTNIPNYANNSKNSTQKGQSFVHLAGNHFHDLIKLEQEISCDLKHASANIDSDKSHLNLLKYGCARMNFLMCDNHLVPKRSRRYYVSLRQYNNFNLSKLNERTSIFCK